MQLISNLPTESSKLNLTGLWARNFLAIVRRCSGTTTSCVKSATSRDSPTLPVSAIQAGILSM